MLLSISGSQDYEMLNAVDSTLPCNSRFARKQEELQVQHDWGVLGIPDLLQSCSSNKV
ncbi:MAG: hypothetical protein WC197_09330 [Candidatus Gastranaerophilaceae bacterium]